MVGEGEGKEEKTSKDDGWLAKYLCATDCSAALVACGDVYVDDDWGIAALVSAPWNA